MTKAMPIKNYNRSNVHLLYKSFSPLFFSFFLAVEDINREDFSGKQKLFGNEMLFMF